VNIQIGEKYLNKDPHSTELGRKLVPESIVLLEQLGFEEFTFKKLLKKLGQLKRPFIAILITS